MESQERKRRLAHEWVEAWNSHDLERILAHYDDAIETVSPVAVDRLKDPSGTVRGKSALREYFKAGLAANPGLNFKILDILLGVDGLTIYYRNHRGVTVAENLELGPSGKVIRSVVNYGQE